MMNNEHAILLILAAQKRNQFTCVDHLARRADLSVEHWRGVARHLHNLGYVTTYDNGVTISITEDGYAEAQRLLDQRQANATRATIAASRLPIPASQDRRCKRCGGVVRPAARFCPQCGISVQS